MKVNKVSRAILKAGAVFEAERSFSQNDFDTFAVLSGDNNPIHVDPVYASGTHFGVTVAHGMLLYTGLRGFLQKLFPGSSQLFHQMMFPSGTTAGETIRYRAEIVSLVPEKHQIKLKVQVFRSCGNLGLDGETLIKWEELS